MSLKLDARVLNPDPQTMPTRAFNRWGGTRDLRVSRVEDRVVVDMFELTLARGAHYS